MSEISRREFMAGAAMLGCCGLFGLPTLSLAAVNTDKRLLVVILRGAMDGLAAVPPIGDKSYHSARGSLALPDNALLPLDGYFAMNAGLKPLHALYLQKQLVVFHAAASPYRDRSHFDAQDLLENGSVKPHGLVTGWLGRTVEAMGGQVKGLAIGPTVPLVLQGTRSIQSWAPSVLPDVNPDFLARIQHMYQNDALLNDALMEATGMGKAGGKDKVAGGPRQFVDMMKTAAKFMNQPDGAKIASIDIGGWDTHANQGTSEGRLKQNLAILAEGVQAYKAGMGDTWNKTAVLMITEFGRTVAANGSGGSDHGTASASFLAGGPVKGGRVLGDWPGLASNRLYEGRDLYPANDLRSLLKTVLIEHLAIPEGVTVEKIFPQSTNAEPLKGLFI